MLRCNGCVHHHYSYSVSSCKPKSFLQTFKFVVHGTYFWNENEFECFRTILRATTAAASKLIPNASFTRFTIKRRRAYNIFWPYETYIPQQNYVKDCSFSFFPSYAPQKFEMFSRGNLIFGWNDKWMRGDRIVMKWISIHLNVRCEIGLLKRTYSSAESFSPKSVTIRRTNWR